MTRIAPTISAAPMAPPGSTLPSARPPGSAWRAAPSAGEILDAAGVDALHRYTRLAASAVGAPMAGLVLVDAGRVWFQSAFGAAAIDPVYFGALCVHPIALGRPVVVPDARVDPRFASSPAVHREPGVGLYVGVPLCTASGDCTGALCAFDVRLRTVAPELLAQLADLAAAVVTTLELYRAVHEVKLLALTDALTGLPNPIRLYQALSTAMSTALRRHRAMSLLVIDCDNFKRFNDAMGHALGDQMLQALAAVLADCVRADELAARLAGDAFAIVLPDAGPRAAMLTARRIRACCTETMAARGWPMTLSIGAVTFLLPPATVDEAIALADEAMDAAKRGGRNQVCAIVIGEGAAVSMASPREVT